MAMTSRNALPAPIRIAANTDAFVEVTLETVRWGSFAQRPACLLGLCLRIADSPRKSGIASAHCALTFSRTPLTTSVSGSGRQSSSAARSTSSTAATANAHRLQVIEQQPVALNGPIVPTDKARTNARHEGDYVTPLVLDHFMGIASTMATHRNAWALTGSINVVAKDGRRRAAWDLRRDPLVTLPLPELMRLAVMVDCEDLEPFELELEVRSGKKSLRHPLGEGRSVKVNLSPEISEMVLGTAGLRAYIRDGVETNLKFGVAAEAV